MLRLREALLPCMAPSEAPNLLGAILGKGSQLLEHPTWGSPTSARSDACLLHWISYLNVGARKRTGANGMFGEPYYPSLGHWERQQRCKKAQALARQSLARLSRKWASRSRELISFPNEWPFNFNSAMWGDQVKEVRWKGGLIHLSRTFGTENIKRWIHLWAIIIHYREK